MTVRHIVLTVSALAVLGLGVYLFFEVRATPATADVPRRAPAPSRDDAPAVAETVRETVREPAPGEVRIPRRDPRPGTSKYNPAPPVATEDPGPATGTEVKQLDALMSEASKAYDRGEFDESKTIAAKALKLDPTSTRMLRIMVSASCIDGNSTDAQKYYLLLPAPDREQMKTRCDRYGVSFNEN